MEPFDDLSYSYITVGVETFIFRGQILPAHMLTNMECVELIYDNVKYCVKVSHVVNFLTISFYVQIIKFQLFGKFRFPKWVQICISLK